MAKNLLTTIQVNMFCAAIFDFTTFHLVLILKEPHLYLQHRCFGICRYEVNTNIVADQFQTLILYSVISCSNS